MITFLALAHMVGATQHHVSCTCTHGWCTQHHVSCTCTHGRCYATSCFLHLHTWSVLRNIMGWGGDDNVPCTCTHAVLRNIMFLALAHMVGATQYHVSCTCTHGWCYATSCFLHLHTWSVICNIMGWGGVGVGWGGDDNVPCTCTHGRCYATSCL